MGDSVATAGGPAIGGSDNGMCRDHLPRVLLTRHDHPISHFMLRVEVLLGTHTADWHAKFSRQSEDQQLYFDTFIAYAESVLHSVGPKRAEWCEQVVDYCFERMTESTQEQRAVYNVAAFVMRAYNAMFKLEQAGRRYLEQRHSGEPAVIETVRLDFTAAKGSLPVAAAYDKRLACHADTMWIQWNTMSKPGLQPSWEDDLKTLHAAREMIEEAKKHCKDGEAKRNGESQNAPSRIKKLLPVAGSNDLTDHSGGVTSLYDISLATVRRTQSEVWTRRDDLIASCCFALEALKCVHYERYFPSLPFVSFTSISNYVTPPALLSVEQQLGAKRPEAIDGAHRDAAPLTTPPYLATFLHRYLDQFIRLGGQNDDVPLQQLALCVDLLRKKELAEAIVEDGDVRAMRDRCDAAITNRLESLMKIFDAGADLRKFHFTVVSGCDHVTARILASRIQPTRVTDLLDKVVAAYNDRSGATVTAGVGSPLSSAATAREILGGLWSMIPASTRPILDMVSSVVTQTSPQFSVHNEPALHTVAANAHMFDVAPNVVSWFISKACVSFINQLDMWSKADETSTELKRAAEKVAEYLLMECSVVLGRGTMYPAATMVLTSVLKATESVPALGESPSPLPSAPSDSTALDAATCRTDVLYLLASVLTAKIFIADVTEAARWKQQGGAIRKLSQQHDELAAVLQPVWTGAAPEAWPLEHPMVARAIMKLLLRRRLLLLDVSVPPPPTTASGGATSDLERDAFALSAFLRREDQSKDWSSASALSLRLQIVHQAERACLRGVGPDLGSVYDTWIKDYLTPALPDHVMPWHAAEHAIVRAAQALSLSRVDPETAFEVALENLAQAGGVNVELGYLAAASATTNFGPPMRAVPIDAVLPAIALLHCACSWMDSDDDTAHIAAMRTAVDACTRVSTLLLPFDEVSGAVVLSVEDVAVQDAVIKAIEKFRKSQAHFEQRISRSGAPAEASRRPVVGFVSADLPSRPREAELESYDARDLLHACDALYFRGDAAGAMDMMERSIIMQRGLAALDDAVVRSSLAFYAAIALRGPVRNRRVRSLLVGSTLDASPTVAAKFFSAELRAVVACVLAATSEDDDLWKFVDRHPVTSNPAWGDSLIDGIRAAPDTGPSMSMAWDVARSKLIWRAREKGATAVGSTAVDDLGLGQRCVACAPHDAAAARFALALAKTTLGTSGGESSWRVAQQAEDVVALLAQAAFDGALAAAQQLSSAVGEGDGGDEWEVPETADVHDARMFLLLTNQLPWLMDKE